MDSNEILKRIDIHLFAMVNLKFVELKMVQERDPAFYSINMKQELRLLHADYAEMLDEGKPSREEGGGVGEGS